MNITAAGIDIPRNCFIDWNKVLDHDVERYQCLLDVHLKAVYLEKEVLNCSDFNCHKESHRSHLQSYYKCIIDACTTAGSVFSKSVSKSSRKLVPGWSDVVSDYKKKALMWHSIWKTNGSPRFGLIANIRRKTRADYHRAVKFVKVNREILITNKMAYDLSRNNTQNFWDAVKKVTKTKILFPNNVDSCCSEEALSNLFVNKYRSLYNSVSYNVNECNKLKTKINDNIKELGAKNKCGGLHKFTVANVKNAISDMKRNKIDSDGEYYSNHFIYGTHRLIVALMIVHGFSPSEFLKAVVIPIPKNKKKSLNNSDNYRGIALGNITGKIMDIMIMNCSKNTFKTCDLQFGF